MQIIKIVCSDATEFEIDLKAAEYIGTINDALKIAKLKNELATPSTTMEQTSESYLPSEPILLSNITGSVMQKVLDYVEHHKNDPPLPPNYDVQIREWDHLDEWDESYLKVDQMTLFSIICAANYLNIKTLLDLTCKAVAGMIRGKGVDELRAYFGAPDDLTEEEKAAIEKENEWLIKDC